MTNGQDNRQARLAQALRTNLRRRKAQMREEPREDTPPPVLPDETKD